MSRCLPSDGQGSGIDERQPLLEQRRAESITGASPAQPELGVPKHLWRRLYLSHFLSTWNSRLFEFGAVLYLATIYPNTLFPMSAYAFARGLSAIVFAPLVGQYIDTGNRLQVVRVSIVGQRLVVAASCAIFFILSTQPYIAHDTKNGLLVALATLACFEKLCSILNLVSVEKDWVVVVAHQDQETLRGLNAQMRRIDLLCKLLAPLLIALIDGISTQVAIIVNFSMNLVSVGFEYYAIARVYNEVPDLQRGKKTNRVRESSGTTTSEPDARNESLDRTSYANRILHNYNHVKRSVKKYGLDFKLYFSHNAFLPSVAGALLYLTVLNFAGQMVTYLLSTGYNSTQIGIARTFSVTSEVLATWMAPWLMSKVGPLRAGLWLGFWQVGSLVIGTTVFVKLLVQQPVIAASGLVIGTIVSRIGLRGFDLCAQLIVQEDVEAENRGAFSSVEAALQNLFELLSYASTMVFYRPEQFQWPVLISVTAVTLASFAYTLFVRLRRGHLIHTEKIAGLCGSSRDRSQQHEQGIRRITSQSDI